MATTNCPTIGRSSVQSVYVEIEDVPGILQRPTAAGFIVPSDQSSMSQTPTSSNSTELGRSLNVTAQFQDAVAAGDVSIPMYLCLNSDYSAPQGDALFTAAMGELQPPDTVTASLKESLTDKAVEIKIDTVSGGFLPSRGVVLIESEKILYTGKTENLGETTLTGCQRGYGGTSAAAHDALASMTYKSRVWMQSICRPTVSVWIEFDHAVLFMSGCAVTATTLPMSNQGGQMCTFTLQGRKMGWCGTGEISSVSGSVITLEDDLANAYRVGGIIKNATKKDDNSGSGYTITAVDVDASTITVSPQPSGWMKGDMLKPWLPEASGIGIPVESRNARVFINGAAGTRREGDITINTPTTFAQEIGDEFPGENADSKREISVSGGTYFRAIDAKQFGLGYDGYELPMTVRFGDRAGNALALLFPRMKFNAPTISADGEFYTLTQDGTALGVPEERGGESSLYLIQE